MIILFAGQSNLSPGFTLTIRRFFQAAAVKLGPEKWLDI